MYEKGTPEWVAAQETIAQYTLSYQDPSIDYWLQLVKPFVTPAIYAQDVATVARGAGSPANASQWAKIQQYKMGYPITIIRSDSADSSNPNSAQATVVVSFQIGSMTGGVAYPPPAGTPVQQVALLLVKVGGTWYVNSQDLQPGSA
jgi:hypothetical protein